MTSSAIWSASASISAVRIGWPRDSGLHASKLCDFQQVAIGDAGIPRQPACRRCSNRDLARCEWIGHTRLSTPWTWTFRTPARACHEYRPEGRLLANNTLAVYRLAI